MEILKYCKLQLGLLVVLIYVSYLFVKDGLFFNKKTGIEQCHFVFDVLFIAAVFSVFIDGVVSVTVNYLDVVPVGINKMLHLLYLLSYQLLLNFIFLYTQFITNTMPTKTYKYFVNALPSVIAALITCVTIPQIEFNIGDLSNYSVGIPVITTYAVVGVYCVMIVIVFVRNLGFIDRKIKSSFAMCIFTVFAVLIFASFNKELQFFSLGTTIIIFSIYLNIESPDTKALKVYNDEMTKNFATMIEYRDQNTGGHIRRTSLYVALIVNELRNQRAFQHLLTAYYIECVIKAAPMHDIGKISIPDNVLMKPAKLTDEEFEIIQKHPEIGANLVQEMLSHYDDEEYRKIAYEVAMYHHEKWNGKGYPKKLAKEEIPLCARIMAVADVFDALSSDRCYREAMPLEKCYKIIEEGSGVDFDPTVVKAFFAKRPQIEEILNSVQ